MAAVRHLGFLKVQNFNCQSGSQGQHASPCQISCGLVKSLLRYGRLPIFQDGGRPPSAFLGEKYEIFSAEVVGSASMHQCSKFHANWQSCCRDMTIFRFFQMAAVRYLGFLTVWNFNCRHDSEGQCTSPCKMGCWSVKPLQSYGCFRFFNMVAVRHLGIFKIRKFN